MFITGIDKRAQKERNRLRRNQPKDLAGATMRLALHLSDIEHDFLERMNPETLGRHDDERLRSMYWAKFMASPESEPYRVNKV